MSVSNGVISAPVDIIDVHDVLGEDNYSLGALCASSKINRWSYRKPIPISQKEELTSTAINTANSGLTPATFTTKSALIAALKNGTAIWTYTKPNGANQARLTDFVGYNHNATHPFPTLAGPMTVQEGENISIVASPPSNSSDSVRLNQLSKPGCNVKDWYFSILIYNDSTTIIRSATVNVSDTTDDAWKVTFESLSSGSYHMVPFLSSVKWTSSGDPSSFTACGMETSPVALTVESSKPRISISVFRWTFSNTTPNTIDYNLYIRNDGEYAVTLQHLYIVMPSATNTPIPIKDFGQVVMTGSKKESGYIDKLPFYASNGSVKVESVMMNCREAALYWDGMNEKDIQWTDFYAQ